MNSTYIKISDEALRHWHMEFAQIILTCERRFARRSVKQVASSLLGCFRLGRRSVAPAGGALLKSGGIGAAGLAPQASGSAEPAMDISYTVVKVEESLPEDKASFGDVFEQSVRDKLRRTVRFHGDRYKAGGRSGSI